VDIVARKKQAYTKDERLLLRVLQLLKNQTSAGAGKGALGEAFCSWSGVLSLLAGL
jgi:hypothetical protein